jgi:hypothetical protein
VNSETNRRFLEIVVVWPGPQGSGWINQHTNFKNEDPTKNGGKPWVVGWPYRDINEFIKLAHWIDTTDKFFNVWICMSQQSDAATNPKTGKLKAVRKATNATALKAIWIDIDFKAKPADWPADKPWTHYEAVNEAWIAFRAFQKLLGLPDPSAVVNSGGGLHIYWASERPLSVDEWKPFAAGLKAALVNNGVKCDAGLTTDAARLLRVPETLNHKYDPPRLVEIVHLGQAYNFETDLSALRGVAPTKSAAKTHPPSLAPVIEPGYESNFENGPDPAFAALDPANNDVSAGIILTGPPLADPTPILQNCAFLGDALKNGGKDHDNPLWHLAVLCTVFMENGRELAHESSKGHPTYTPAETQAMYERKLADRAQGIGPPRCATISGAGCKACATCPFFARGKTPLHLTGPITATVIPSPSVSIWSSTAMNVVFTKIPHRRTLYGYDLIRGEVTVLGSPGGFGKSSLAIGMSISIAVGKELLGERIYGTALTAVLINAEDSTDEIHRRVLAASLVHGVLEPELTRLHAAGTDHPGVQALSFLRTNLKGVSDLDVAGLAALEALLNEFKPDLVVLDPLVALCSNGNINDNSSMSLVIRALKRLAIKFDCAILIVHHTRKGGDAGNAESISGAGSITNLSRRTIMPVPITMDEALKLGIPSAERWRYFKLVDAKSNLAPRGIDPAIYRLHSIDLQNAEPPTYPFGDNVQAVVRVQPSAQSGGTGATDEDKIRQAIVSLVDRGKMIDGKSYPYSPTLAGAANARALLPDALAAAQVATAPAEWAPGDIEAVVKATIKNLLRQGVLVPGEMEKLVPEPGRFRKGRGLRVDHSRFSQGGSNGAGTKAAA